MLNEWPAEDYAVGSYIQSTVADSLLPGLESSPTDKVLDIGCGNGAYTRKILEKVPQGSVLGIDPSENMLQLAKNVINDYPNFSVKQDNVLSMTYSNQFDLIVSFWCLQWATDIKLAFSNIINALKPGGSIFTLFPAGDDPYIMGYYAVKESGQFPCLNNFKAPVNYSELDGLSDKLKSIPRNNLDVVLHRASIILPSLDVFRKFVYGIAFFQGQIPESDIKRINDAMVAWYETECQKNWQGEYQFNFSIYLVTGKKL